MSDCFLAKVLSYNVATNKAKIQPLVILKDGTELSNIVDASPVSGIVPTINDTVLIVTSRNNLDDKSISEYYKPSWANCRIVAIVSTNGSYTLKGNHIFKDNVTFEKDVTIEGNLTVEGEVTVQGQATFEDDAYFETDAFFGLTQISFLAHTHIAPPLGGNTSPPQ